MQSTQQPAPDLYFYHLIMLSSENLNRLRESVLCEVVGRFVLIAVVEQKTSKRGHTTCMRDDSGHDLFFDCQLQIEYSHFDSNSRLSPTSSLNIAPFTVVCQNISWTSITYRAKHFPTNRIKDWPFEEYFWGDSSRFRFSRSRQDCNRSEWLSLSRSSLRFCKAKQYWGSRLILLRTFPSHSECAP